MLATIFIDDNYLHPEESTNESSFCMVAYNQTIEALLAAVYGRDNLCLKIFKKPVAGLTAKTFKWGGTPLWYCTVIQNLFAFHGMAPRVFGIVRVGNQLAQVTPFIPPGEPPPTARVAELRGLLDHYSLGVRKNHWDVNPRNWRGELFVDFSGFHFQDLEAYETDLIRQAHTRRGQYIGIAYQPVPELGIIGTRNMKYRLAAMRLNEISFVDKTVLDIGCNLGYLCRWTRGQGARRVVGVDRIAGLTYQLANWLGDWQTDYLRLRLPDEVGEISVASGIEKFDVVIATAVVKHVGGLAAWLVELCQGTFIFEGHGSIEADAYLPQLETYFRDVRYIGYTEDNYRRHLFQCEV